MIYLIRRVIQFLAFICIFLPIGILTILLALIFWDSKFMDSADEILYRIWDKKQND